MTTTTHQTPNQAATMPFANLNNSAGPENPLETACQDCTASRQARLRESWDESEREKRSALGVTMQMQLANLIFGLI
jgi:hypothetical protein